MFYRIVKDTLKSIYKITILLIELYSYQRYSKCITNIFATINKFILRVLKHFQVFNLKHV